MDLVKQVFRPRHWLLALLPLVLMMIFSLFSSLVMRTGMMSQPMQQVFKQADGKPDEQYYSFRAIMAPLGPLTGFGMVIHIPIQQMMGEAVGGAMGGLGTLTGDPQGDVFGSGLGSLFTKLVGNDMEFTTSSTWGVIALLIGLLLAGLIVMDSRACWQSVGPLAIYCLILTFSVNQLIIQMASESQANMYASESQFNQAFAPLTGLVTPSVTYWPYIMKFLVVALIAGLVAQFILKMAGAQGLLPLQDLSPSAPLLGPAPRPAPAAGLAPGGGMAPAGAVAQVVGDQKVRFAAVCPFCGNHRIRHNAPGLCSTCKRNIGVMTERADGQTCEACGGILVKQALFCHHCGVWLKQVE